MSSNEIEVLGIIFTLAVFFFVALYIINVINPDLASKAVERIKQALPVTLLIMVTIIIIIIVIIYYVIKHSIKFHEVPIYFMVLGNGR